MNTWTEVTGIIRCDWISFSYPDKEKVHMDKLERLALLTQLFDENNAPQGTEDLIRDLNRERESFSNQIDNLINSL